MQLTGKVDRESEANHYLNRLLERLVQHTWALLLLHHPS